MKQAYGLLILVPMSLTLIPADCLAGEWGLGIGVAAQRQPQQGTDTQLFVLPFPSYEGERLSLGFGSISYSLSGSDRFRVALEGQVRFDGYDPDDSASLAGMAQRDPTLDVGISITTGEAWGIASLKVVGDALGIHEGYEVSATYEYPVGLEHWTVVPSIGVNWRSANLVDYYYGVRSTEAAAGRPIYSGKSVVNTSVGVTVARKIAEQWQLVGGAEYVGLGDGIKDSPIIDKNYEATAFSALVYRF
jgi:outer membrane protein